MDRNHGHGRRRRAAWHHRSDRLRAERRRRVRTRAIAAMMSAAALASSGVALTGDGAFPALAGETHDAAMRCLAVMDPPLADARMTRAFDNPAQPWLPGHRGIDLEASPGEPVFAPADGIVSFAGEVAGKQVVSVRHGVLVSSFEPAVTQLPTGAPVMRGMPFATVSERSDHCDGGCLHWGVRRAAERYVDPQILTEPARISLKPL